MPFLPQMLDAVSDGSSGGSSDILNAKTDFGAAGDGTTDDTAALNRAIAAASKATHVLYLPVGTYRITDELQIPFSPGLRLLGAGAEITRIRQDGAARPILHFTAGLTNTVHIADMTLEYSQTQTDARSNAVFYRDATDPSATWFRHVYERLIVRNAYNGFAVDRNYGNSTVWQTVWRDVNLYRTKHSAFALIASAPGGQPTLSFDNVGVFNTGDGGLTSTGPAFEIAAGEVNMRNIDVEGWTDEVLSMSGGVWATIVGLHVESHVFAADNSRLVYIANGYLSVDGFGISGVAANSNTSSTILFAAAPGSRLTLRNGNHGVDTTASSAYILEVFWNNDPGQNFSVVVENLRKVSGGVAQPGTGTWASLTRGMMTAIGIMPDGKRGLAAPAGGGVYITSPNGTAFVVHVTDGGTLSVDRA